MEEKEFLDFCRWNYLLVTDSLIFLKIKEMRTINLNSNFLSYVPVGSWLEAKGKVVKYGRRLVFVNIDMYLKKKIWTF